MELVIIGTTEFLPGFALAGVRTTALASPEDVLERIREHQDAGIIVLDEELTRTLPAEARDALETSIRPVIIILGKSGDDYTRRLKSSIMQTMGVDLLR